MQVLVTWIVDFNGNLTELYSCRNNWWFIYDRFYNSLIIVEEGTARKLIEDSKFEK